MPAPPGPGSPPTAGSPSRASPGRAGAAPSAPGAAWSWSSATLPGCASPSTARPGRGRPLRQHLAAHVHPQEQVTGLGQERGPMVTRVPFTGEEKESLKAALDRHRDAVLWKLERQEEHTP